LRFVGQNKPEMLLWETIDGEMTMARVAKTAKKPAKAVKKTKTKPVKAVASVKRSGSARRATKRTVKAPAKAKRKTAKRAR
jgi:adenylate kinase